MWFRFLVVSLVLTASVYASASLADVAHETLLNVRQTRYNHKPFIDEGKGIYIVDCSSFVGFLLQKVSLQSYQALSIDKGHTRPRAQNFYDFLASLKAGETRKGWLGIKTMSSVQKWDIIAWKYAKNLDKKDTGHVVIVYETPKKEPDGRYKVVVLDASKGTHANDSRAQNKDGGIGIGTMWFKVDKEGKPIGLYWSERSHAISEHVMAMGRVVL